MGTVSGETVGASSCFLKFNDAVVSPAGQSLADPGVGGATAWHGLWSHHLSLEGVLWYRSHHGSYPSRSGSIWGGAVRRCLALLTGHHPNVHMVDRLYRAAANWKLWTGFVGDLCGPGAGSAAMPGLRWHPGPAAGHKTGPDPHVSDAGGGTVWLPVGRLQHAARQLPPWSTGTPLPPKGHEDCRGGAVCGGRDPGDGSCVAHRSPRRHSIPRQVCAGGGATLGVWGRSVLWVDSRGPSPAGWSAAAHFLFVCSDRKSRHRDAHGPSWEAAQHANGVSSHVDSSRDQNSSSAFVPEQNSLWSWATCFLKRALSSEPFRHQVLTVENVVKSYE